MDTIVYLIRHAETIDENGIRNTNEDSQMINEKEILQKVNIHIPLWLWSGNGFKEVK